MATKLLGLATAVAALALASGSAGALAGPLTGDVRVTAAVGNEVVQLVEPAPKVTQVVVNDRVVFEEHDGPALSFVNAYDVKGRWLVLLQQGAEGGCAARYRVLDLSGAKPGVSPPFGTCSEAAEVATADRALTVSMPIPGGAGGKATAAWSYLDGRLTRLR
ncbi:hypothetical protein [Azospirillum sp. sgz302134]